MNILSSPFPQLKSNEETIRLRHLLEDNIICYFKILSIAKIRELEISLARLMDLSNQINDEKEKIHMRFQIALVQTYYLLRQNGKRNIDNWKRIWNDEYHSPDELIEKIVKMNIVPEGLIIDELPSSNSLIEIAKKYS